MKNKYRHFALFFCLAAGDCTTTAFGQDHPATYEGLIQQGNAQLKAGSADTALTAGQAAVKSNSGGWEGYTLEGGALMNLKRYEEAADAFSKAIEWAPESKQATLRELRRQCLQTPANPSHSVSVPPTGSPTTQAEIVLWKSIEKSSNPGDFQTYLSQYPQGAFVALARRNLAEAAAVTAAQTNCVHPAAPSSVDGRSATKEQMLIFKHSVDSYNTEMNAYLDCMKAEKKTADSKDASTGMSNVEGRAIERQKSLVKRNNDAVDELQAVVANFNEQLKIYKSR